MSSADDRLKDVCEVLKGAIDVRDRKHHLRSYRKTFVAKEACLWLILNKQCADESGATVLGNQLIEAGYIVNVSHPKKRFEPNGNLFRFCSQNTPYRFSFTQDMIDPNDLNVSSESVDYEGIPEDEEVNGSATTAMVYNPLRSGTTSILLSADGDINLFSEGNRETNTDALTTAEVKQRICRDLQRGVTSLQKLNTNFERDYGTDNFKTWKDFVEEIHSQYASRVEAMLKLIADQKADIHLLDSKYTANESKLAWLGQVVTTLAASIKKTMALASNWDVPPVSFTILANQANIRKSSSAEESAIQHTPTSVKDKLTDDYIDVGDAAKDVVPQAVQQTEPAVQIPQPVEMRRRSSAMQSIGSRVAAIKSFRKFTGGSTKKTPDKNVSSDPKPKIAPKPNIQFDKAKPTVSKPIAAKKRRDSGVSNSKGSPDKFVPGIELGGFAEEEEEEGEE